jgi:hypothetical protein
MRGIPSLPEAFVLFAANSGRLPSACHAGSFRRTRTGTTIRRKIAGKIRGRKKRRALPDRYASLQASPFWAGSFTVAEVLMVGFTQIYLTQAGTAFRITGLINNDATANFNRIRQVILRGYPFEEAVLDLCAESGSQFRGSGPNPVV